MDVLKKHTKKTKQTDDILPLITDIGLLNVINNCPQINSIEFYGRPNISHKTIDALIALALQKHKIYFKHRFDIRDSAEDIVFNVIDLDSYQLLSNLVIEDYEQCSSVWCRGCGCRVVP